MPSSEAAAKSSTLPDVWLRLSLFASVLALGWLALEWGIARVPNSMSVKRDRLHAQAAHVDTLILGSSETYYGIAPHKLSGVAFNLANWSQSLYYDYQLTSRVLPKLPRLRRAIILFNYMSLYTELYDHPESWRQYQYFQEWGIPLQRPQDYLNVRLLSRVAVYSPHTALELAADGFHGSLAARVDPHGWYRVPDEDRWGLGPREAAGRLAVHHGFMRQAHLTANAAQLEQLLALLRAHRIEAVLVTTPVWPTYSAGIRQPMWLRAKQVMERLRRKYGARYLDFQHEPRLTAEHFEDADHLNADGAVRFAALLDQALAGQERAANDQPGTVLAAPLAARPEARGE